VRQPASRVQPARQLRPGGRRTRPPRDRRAPVERPGLATDLSVARARGHHRARFDPEQAAALIGAGWRLMGRCGWVAERLKAPVLKTGRGQPLVGSNPTPSANELGNGTQPSDLGKIARLSSTGQPTPRYAMTSHAARAACVASTWPLSEFSHRSNCHSIEIMRYRNAREDHPCFGLDLGLLVAAGQGGEVRGTDVCGLRELGCLSGGEMTRLSGLVGITFEEGGSDAAGGTAATVAASGTAPTLTRLLSSAP
jgi:hypothetical protein